MKTRLNLGTLVRLPAAVQRPDYDFQNLQIGIVHLGVGAFHRAHQALYTEDAVRCAGGEWGILGVSLRNSATPAALEVQDHLYTVETLGDEMHYRVVAAVRGSLTASTQRTQLLSALGSPRIQVVTLTITERGYCLGMNGELDAMHPEVAQDLLNPAEPRSAIGWVAAGLAERHGSHRQPLTVVSCDNLRDNGAKLGAAVGEFVRRRWPHMLPWLKDCVAFPRTVVDCIVPAATAASRARVSRALAEHDAACVQREAYSQWVIEDRFAGARPAWDRVGVQIVADVSGFGRLKLHVLNTCHSALAYLGLARGYSFVREAMADTDLAQFLDGLVANEIAPALTSLPALEYWQTVRARFSNPRIDHRLAQIAEEGSLKLAERVFPLMIANALSDAPVRGLACIVRSWLQLLRVQPTAALDDPALFPSEIRGNQKLRTAIAAAVT